MLPVGLDDLEGYMAQETNWREKVGSVLLTILITALGSVAVQSAKYIGVDFEEHRKIAQVRMEEKLAATKLPLEYWKGFNDSYVETKNASDQREKVFTETLKDLSASHMDTKKIGHALETAYSNLGTISYAPVLGPAMESERATLVQDIKIEIEGLELLYNWAEMPGTPKEKVKLARALERNQLQRIQTAHASLAAIKASMLESDRDKEADAKVWKQNREDYQEDLQTLRMARNALMTSLVGWVWVVSFFIRSKPKPIQEEKV